MNFFSIFKFSFFTYLYFRMRNGSIRCVHHRGVTKYFRSHSRCDKAYKGLTITTDDPWLDYGNLSLSLGL